MRKLAPFLFWLCLVAPISFAIVPSDAVAGRSIPVTTEPVGPEGVAADDSVFAQEVVLGAVIMGGAFAVGLVAGAGSLSTALTAAGAVVIFYALMP